MRKPIIIFRKHLFLVSCFVFTLIKRQNFVLISLRVHVSREALRNSAGKFHLAMRFYRYMMPIRYGQLVLFSFFSPVFPFLMPLNSWMFWMGKSIDCVPLTPWVSDSKIQLSMNYRPSATRRDSQIGNIKKEKPFFFLFCVLWLSLCDEVRFGAIRFGSFL